MRSKKVTVFCTGGCRVPTSDVIEKLEEVLGASKNYSWKLNVDEVTGVTRILCYSVKNKKQMLVEGVHARIDEPLQSDRLFSQFMVELVVVGMMKPWLLADKLYEDISTFASEFAQSFRGHPKRPSVYGKVLS